MTTPSPLLTRRQLVRQIALGAAACLASPLLTAGATPTPATAHGGPRLWFSATEVPRLRRRARRGWPGEIAAGARALALQRPEITEVGTPAQWVEAAALTYVLTGDRAFAQHVETVTTQSLSRTLRSDLGTAAQLRTAVIAFDLCGDAWAPETRQRFAEMMGRHAHRLASTQLSSDNPDNPFNNWWGVTQSAAALTSLLLQDYDPSLRDLHRLTHERVRTYLLNYGDHGHYYEGTSYGFYAMTHWAPYVLAARRVAGMDAAVLAPGLARLPTLAHALTVARPQRSDSQPAPATARVGMRVAWNDDGGHWPGSDIAGLLLALAPATEHAHLRWLHDRLTGPEGDRTDAHAESGSLWPFLYYPVDTPAHQPEGPLFCLDQRTGLVVFRNRYRDADDCVFATYAKTYHGGGHVQDDLGSWRFQGLGGGWAQAGGQAKPAAHFQSVVTRDGRRNDGRHGQISYLVPPDASGMGSVSLRLGPASASRRWDRHFLVDYSGAAGVPALLGLVDECLHETEAEWTWSLCFERELQYEPLPAQNGFRLVSPQGASLVFSFGAPQSLQFTLHESPASERTFSNGSRRVYPGVPYITTSVRAREVTFFAVATLQNGAAPAVQWQPDPATSWPRAQVGPRQVHLARGKWFHGPLRGTGA